MKTYSNKPNINKINFSQKPKNLYNKIETALIKSAIQFAIKHQPHLNHIHLKPNSNT